MSAIPESGRSDGPIITNMTVRFRPIADGHVPSGPLRYHDPPPCALDSRHNVRIQVKKIGWVILVLQGKQSVVVTAVVSVNLLL